MAALSSAEEEAVKRNTDCVYFLASPLTCKKGSECEYRHSDVARVNPRDCWFWLHGNCLNPKCGFRHPPLDGLLGTQTPTSIDHSLAPSQNTKTPASNVPNSFSRQPVPCVFYQQGFCLKGDWCPFLHAPNSIINKPSLLQATADAAAEPTIFNNTLGGNENFSLEKKVPPIVIANSVKVSQKAKPAVEMERAPPRNEFPMRRISHTPGVNEMHDYSVSNGNPFRLSDRVQQYHLSGEPGTMSNKDVEEVSREPSPGFDVLVDDERRDSDYYPNEDQYGMQGEHEARNEYDIDPAVDYNLMSDIDSERFHDPLRYDMHEIREGRYALERRRDSSERMSGGGYLERRPYARIDSVNKVDELDLRHRLNKRKKTNGLRSVISHEHSRDRQVEDRRYPGFHRNEQRDSLHVNSLSNRLRGRISLPGRSSPSNKDTILVPDRGRLSPVRTSSSSHQGRIQDRIKGRVGEDFHNGGKKHQDMHFNKDTTGHDSADFTGPKTLAALKNQKDAQPSRRHEAHEQPLGKRKHLMCDGYHGDDLFEGPKPLEEILKRKRGENIGIESGKKSPDREGNFAHNDEKDGNDMANTSEDKSIKPLRSNKDVFKSVSVDKIKAEEGRSAANSVASLQTVPRKRAAEDDINVVDEVGKGGESDCEQAGGENYDVYDGENGDVDGEYLEDDDDDFAKKMGVMYS